MERSSYFIENKALFGSYPTQKSIDELEKNGVKYFINLTYNIEKKITPYKTNYIYINYPIHDQGVPKDIKSFSKFILNIVTIINSLKNNELIYIHCKGGHGRSGLVVACLLCYIYNLHPKNALLQTKHYHNNRPVMNHKWRLIGSPQTIEQKNFVYKFFKPLILKEENIIIDLCLLKIIEHHSDTKIIKNCNEVGVGKSSMLFYILYELLRFNDVNLKNLLINSGLKPIICEENILGKVLSQLREDYYLEKIE